MQSYICAYKYFLSILSRYLRAVRFPPQNSAGAKKLGGDPLLVNARLVIANNQWGMNTPH
ncbi:hypothetical protein COI59_24960 [Bacillus toyonensis]|nr:hypothetical protein COI59_24960 [Bacillus toyonensis]